MTTLVNRAQGPNQRNAGMADPVLQAGNILINQDNYDASLDRIYNIKGVKDAHVEITNQGAVNSLIYRIENTTREFINISTLVDGDFTEEITPNTQVDPAAVAFGTVTCTSVVGGVRANGTVTILGVTAGQTVTVNGLLYTAVAGVKANNEQFSIDGTDTASAIDLVDSVNNDTRVGTLNDLTAANVLGVVTFTQTITGTDGNATTLVSSDGVTLAVSGAVFTGGITGDTVDVNGLRYTAVVGPKANNTEFSGVTDDLVAAALALSITLDTRVGTIGNQTATSLTNVCTITASFTGSAGNTITLSSSDGATLAVSGATFSGGVDDTSFNSIIDISPETTAIRIRVRRASAGLDTTMAGIVSVV